MNDLYSVKQHYSYYDDNKEKYLLKSSMIQNQSYFEVKVYGEYNAIFNNLIADEKKNNFLANSDIRIRLTDDLWIPITIKYDTDKSNFLGFLNVTYNFNPLSSKK